MKEGGRRGDEQGAGRREQGGEGRLWKAWKREDGGMRREMGQGEGGRGERREEVEVIDERGAGQKPDEKDRWQAGGGRREERGRWIEGI